MDAGVFWPVATLCVNISGEFNVSPSNDTTRLRVAPLAQKEIS